MDKEELKEAFVKLCDYWFGEYGYSIRDSGVDSNNCFFVDAVGFCAHDGLDFDVEEGGCTQSLFLEKGKDSITISATAYERNAIFSDVMEFIRYGIEKFFIIKIHRKKCDNGIIYKIISIRNTNN